MLHFVTPPSGVTLHPHGAEGWDQVALVRLKNEGAVTMPNVYQLPQGIRLNNPGNLKGYPGMMYNDGYENGFAKFRTMQDGLEALASQVWMNYKNHGLITLKSFVQRYAPASENDVRAYINMLCQFAGYNPLKQETADLHLDRRWNAFDLIRAISKVENGHPGIGWYSSPEWFNPDLLVDAMARTNKWTMG